MKPADDDVSGTRMYLRILRYLRPHAGLFGLAVAAMAVYSALDALSLTLIIPFLEFLFGQEESSLGAAGKLFGGGGTPPRTCATSSARTCARRIRRWR